MGLRDETSEKLDALPPLTTPPTTPPLVDSENTVKISSDCNCDPTHDSAASENNNQITPNNNKTNQDYLPLPVPMEAATNLTELSEYLARKAEAEAKGERLPGDDLVRAKIPHTSMLQAFLQEEVVED